MTKRYFAAILAVLMIIASSGLLGPEAFAAGSLRLIIDGKDLTETAMPIIRDGRTLVPLRFISEELGALVQWNDKDRTVEVEKGSTYVKLKIGSRLITAGKAVDYSYLSDVAPIIINSRTYVPLRLLANMLNIEVGWTDATRTVTVNSSKPAAFTPFYDVKVSGIAQGQDISAGTQLKITASASTLKAAKEVRFILMDPATHKGDVVARNAQLTAGQAWLPRISHDGKMVLVGALFDSNGNFMAGDAVAVNVNAKPRVTISGVPSGLPITGEISITPGLNFVASYAKLEVLNLEKGTSTLTGVIDPYAPYKWTPQYGDNGTIGFKFIAYDENDRAYESEVAAAKVTVERKLTLAGVKKDQVVDKAVNLIASRNFPVSETEYIVKDKVTGKETLLARIPYGSYSWFPGPELAGDKNVIVRVKDGAGNVYESPPVSVKIPGKAMILLEGIGPKQVVTASVKLKVSGNVRPDSVSYVLTELKTGAKKILASGVKPGEEFTFTPGAGGDFQLQAEGLYSGSKIFTEKIPFKVYLGTTYGPRPVVAKSEFQALASGLAKSSWKKTGMSAALQTAQAILETGWGQSIPVDKYSGKFSYNLFGIKGSASAGSVISNTWEEYNGQRFRIEANFRAYKNIEESWNDHKKLLLEKERYGIFRDVMHDSILGAWAVKRAGYATDSQYPIKLMNLIKQYNLQDLDKVSI